MIKKALFILLFSSTCFAGNLADFKYQYWNQYTGKPDGYMDNVSSSTWAATIAPQQYYYFDNAHSTYLYYDGVSSIYLIVNNVQLDKWSYSAPAIQNVVYQGQQLIYQGQPIKY